MPASAVSSGSSSRRIRYWQTPLNLWNSRVAKVGQLKRDLVRLKKRKEE